MPEELKLKSFSEPKKVFFAKPPPIDDQKETISCFGSNIIGIHYQLLHISKLHWAEGLDRLDYNENEVTRLGTEHACVVNGKHLNFITVSKEERPGSLLYGEYTDSPPIVDGFYQFYHFTPINENSCELEIEAYWEAKSPI